MDACWSVLNEEGDLQGQEIDLFKELASVTNHVEVEESANDGNMDNVNIEEMLQHLNAAAGDGARQTKQEENDEHPSSSSSSFLVVEPNRVPEEVMEELPGVPEVETVRPRRSRLSARQISKRLTQDDDHKDKEDPVNAPRTGKKLKLYQQKTFSDPDQERARRNAINAKKNRDRKKKEKEALQMQINLLRREVQELRKERNAFAKEAKTARDVLARHNLVQLLRKRP